MTIGQSKLFILCGAVVAMSGLGILASGNGIDLASWLMFAIGLLNVGIGLLNYFIARRRPRP